MIRTPDTPNKFNPQLLDYCFDELTAALEANFDWLDKAYGKIERFVEGKGRKAKKFPAIYIGGKKDNGYLKLFPDSHIGNFSYIEVEKQEVDDRRGNDTYMTEFSLIFWFNFKKIYPDDHKTHTIENVKSQVMAFLNQYPFKNFRIRVQNFKEGANDVYRGFDHEEIDNQFMMRPYGGFKVGCKMRHHERCELGSSAITMLPTTSYGINLYSLVERNTGLLDYDGKEIYVSGHKFPSPQTSPLVFPNLKFSQLGRIVDSRLIYEGIDGGNVVIEEGALTTIVNDEMTQLLKLYLEGMNSDPIWFLWYTKT